MKIEQDTNNYIRHYCKIEDSGCHKTEAYLKYKRSRNQKNSLFFEQVTGLNGISGKWIYPYGLTANIFFRDLSRYAYYDDELLEDFYKEFISLNPIWKGFRTKSWSTKWDILRGAGSHYNYDDIYSFAVSKIYGDKVSRKVEKKKRFIEKKLGFLFEYIPSEKTINLIIRKMK